MVYVPIFDNWYGRRFVPTHHHGNKYYWAKDFGGNRINHRVHFGTVRPDGKTAHGGIATKLNNGGYRIVFH